MNIKQKVNIFSIRQKGKIMLRKIKSLFDKIITDKNNADCNVYGFKVLR